MLRRPWFASFLTLVIIAGAAIAAAAPIKLARHPDYHAGKIVFSYLGDIWIANEDGTGAHASPITLARDIYPRFSPDGKWIAFSSNRYGNNDVFVVPAAGGARERLTFHTGNDEVVGWIARRQEGASSARARRRRVPERRDAVPDCRSTADRSSRCRSTGATGAASRPTASRWSSTAIPRRGRAGTIAAATPPTCGSPTSPTRPTRSCSPTSSYNRYWPMWGADDDIYFVADPLPNEKTVKPGSPDVRKSVNNIYKIPANGGQPVQVTKHTDGSLFWPSMSSDGKTIVYEENFGIWKLDVASGRTSEIKIDIGTDDKENEVEIRDRSPTKSMRSTSRRRAAAR